MITQCELPNRGLGLALAMLPIESQAIKSGKLVAPFAVRTKYEQDMYAVYRSEDKTRHDIRCFLDWLIDTPQLQTN
jgi:LysR family glycine cleavage system transcriptional activator